MQRLILTIGALLLGYKLIGATNKIGQIGENIYVQPRIGRIKPGLLQSEMQIFADIKNVSGINLTLKNIFAKMFFENSKGELKEFAFSIQTPQAKILNNQTSAVPLEFTVNNITTASALLSAKKVIIKTYYDVLGQRLSFDKEIDLIALKNMLPFMAGRSKNSAL